MVFERPEKDNDPIFIEAGMSMSRSCRTFLLMVGAALLFLFVGNTFAATLSKTPATTSQQAKPVVNQPVVEKLSLKTCPELKVVSPDILPMAQTGRDYTCQLMTFGGSGKVAFALADREPLPEGFSLSANGLLTGRAVKTGDYVFSVLVQDSCPKGRQQVRKKLSLKVNPALSLTKTVTMEQNRPGVPPLSLSKNNGEFMTLKPQSSPKPLEVRTLASEFKKVPAAEIKAKQVKSMDTHVQGQIVVTMQLSQGETLVRQLQLKYKLNLIESFAIKTLKQMVATFRTDQDVMVLIPKISREYGVILAQKNLVYGTFAEPKSDLQSLAGVLDFPKLHQSRRGKNVTVALIDTGVDLAHEDLKRRVIYSENYIKNSSYRAEVHGTAVAGIIAASINDFGIEGIAPEADLLALRACEQVSEKESLGKGSTTSVVQALDTAIEKKARVVNMSFGSSMPDPLITSLIAEGVRLGILFVAPVGNIAGQKRPAFPASCKGVIAVGGLDEQGNPFPDKHLASFARALAPAENIFTTMPNNKHNFMTGTSFSSAIVSGVLALGVEHNPTLRLAGVPEKSTDLNSWMGKLLSGPNGQ